MQRVRQTYSITGLISMPVGVVQKRTALEANLQGR